MYKHADAHSLEILHALDNPKKSRQLKQVHLKTEVQRGNIYSSNTPRDDDSEKSQPRMLVSKEDDLYHSVKKSAQ